MLHTWNKNSFCQGATLTDLAEKINANPAALVTVLFHLGEMATATQSLDEDTFALLGAELGYNVQIVSPEDEDRKLLESFSINRFSEFLWHFFFSSNIR